MLFTLRRVLAEMVEQSKPGERRDTLAEVLTLINKIVSFNGNLEQP